MPLSVGSIAPAFTLKDQNGKSTSLSDFKGKPVVVYFYPKDETPGCTAEACQFRDQYEDFKEAGAEVIGISTDSSESHAQFVARHRLPFILLSDPQGKVAKLFGVSKTFGILLGRVTFVIDGQGTIQHAYSSQLRVTQHVKEALKVISFNINQPGGTP